MTTDVTGGEVARGVAVSTASQMVAKALHLALNVVSSLVIIRYLAPGAYGEYVLILTVTTLSGLLADFGFPKLAVREVARDADSEADVLGTVILARLGLAVAAFGIVQALLALLGSSGEVRVAAAVISMLFFVESLLTVTASFHVRLHQQYEALVRVVGEAVETGLVIWLVSRGTGLVGLVSAPVVGGGVALALAFAIARRRYRLRFSLDTRRLRYLVQEALPVGPAMLLGVILLKIDTFMLAAMRSSEEVGLYGAALQPIEYLFLASGVLINVLFPVLVRYHATDRDRFRSTYRRGSEALLAVFLPVPVLMAVVATPLVTTVYGADYAASAAPLQVLALTLVLMIASGWAGVVLLGVGMQRVTLRYNLSALLLAVILNGALITVWGYMGAAVATLAVNGYTMARGLRALAVGTGATFEPGPMARIVAANLGVGAVALLVNAWGPWWLAVLVGAASYPAWLAAFRVVRPESIRTNLAARTGAA